MVVNYNSYTSKEPRAISRCDYDAELLLTSFNRVRPKEKARSQFSYVPGFRVSILVLSLEFYAISSYNLYMNEMTTPIS